MYRNLITAFRRPDRRLGDLFELDDHLLADIGLTRADLQLLRSGRRDRTARRDS